MQGLGKAWKWRALPGASFPLPCSTSWVITRCRGRCSERSSFQDISDFELVIEEVHMSWHARFIRHSPPNSSCVPLGWSWSGLMIHKHSDRGTSKEPTNPCQEWIYRYLWYTITWVPSGGLPVWLLLRFISPGAYNHRSNCNFHDISLWPTQLHMFDISNVLRTMCCLFPFPVIQEFGLMEVLNIHIANQKPAAKCTIYK